MAAYLKKPFSHNPLIARKLLIRVTLSIGRTLQQLVSGSSAADELAESPPCSRGTPKGVTAANKIALNAGENAIARLAEDRTTRHATLAHHPETQKEPCFMESDAVSTSSGCGLLAPLAVA